MGETSIMSGQQPLHRQFIVPQYQSNCFSNIPPFVRSLLLDEAPSRLALANHSRVPQRSRHVIFLFLDSFGWQFFEQHADSYPFLRRFLAGGSVTRLTSQFPSTTAAHVTTLYTGVPVGQHGVFEWQYYEPRLDTLISPLLFSFAGTKTPDTLLPTGVKPEEILPHAAFVQDLARDGVACTIFQKNTYANSTYSRWIGQGATLVPFRTLAEGLSSVSRVLKQQTGPTFLCLYYDQIDFVSHNHGPNSPSFLAELDECFAALERWFREDLAKAPRDTVLVITADHGQIPVTPPTTIYLNRQPQIEQLQPMLRVNRAGKAIVPGGSCRDMFLYIQETALDDAHALLSSQLEGKALVCRVSELIAQGYFGPLPVSETFLSHVGNLVILPFAGEAVWWYEEGRFEQKFFGHHGGLTPGEMEIPLLIYALG